MAPCLCAPQGQPLLGIPAVPGGVPIIASPSQSPPFSGRAARQPIRAQQVLAGVIQELWARARLWGQETC